MKKELPINLKTTYKTYPYNAFYLGVFEANCIPIDSIVLNHFLNIFSYTTKGIFKIDFFGSGKIKNNGFNIQYFSNKNIKKEYIINCIDKCEYLFVIMNEHYIMNSNVHQNNDYCHDWLIYGYDNYFKKFLCAGYVGKNIHERIYTSIELSFEEVEKAVNTVTASYLKSKPKDFRNHSFRIDYNCNIHDINEQKLLKLLSNYFYNQKFEKFKYKNFKRSYNSKAVKKFIKKFYKDYVKNNKSRIRLENFGIYYEHKLTLLLALKKISQNDSDINAYKNIVDNTYMCLLMALKYNSKRFLDGMEFHVVCFKNF